MCLKANVDMHTHTHRRKCVRSLSIFLMCVQDMRILMDHKGVGVQVLTGAISIFFFRPVKFDKYLKFCG